jgi:hypothetical protein
MTGPVQVLVVGFEAPSLSGEVLAELARLRDRGVVRLVDVLLVERGEDGTFEILEPPPGSDPDLGKIAAEILGGGESDGDESLSETWSLADAVPTGGVAAIALVEHLWAGPLVAAIGRAGGVRSVSCGYQQATCLTQRSADRVLRPPRAHPGGS